jgi:hypothetical protein
VGFLDIFTVITFSGYQVIWLSGFLVFKFSGFLAGALISQNAARTAYERNAEMNNGQPFHQLR